VADPLDLSSGRRLGLLKVVIVEQARPLRLGDIEQTARTQQENVLTFLVACVELGGVNEI